MGGHLTDAGKEYVEGIVDRFQSEYNADNERSSAAIWEDLAKSEDFDWALMSGSRCVARLPTMVEDVPLIDPPGDYVIKIDVGAIDQLTDPIRWQNHTEVHIWQQAKERSAEHLFAEIVAADTESYRWLIMEECTVPGYDPMRFEMGDRKKMRYNSPAETKMKQFAAEDPSNVPRSPISELECGLSAVGLKIGASPSGQTGLTQDGRPVLLDYAHVISLLNSDETWYASTHMMDGTKIEEKPNSSEDTKIEENPDSSDGLRHWVQVLLTRIRTLY